MNNTYYFACGIGLKMFVAASELRLVWDKGGLDRSGA